MGMCGLWGCFEVSKVAPAPLPNRVCILHTCVSICVATCKSFVPDMNVLAVLARIRYVPRLAVENDVGICRGSGLGRHMWVTKREGGRDSMPKTTVGFSIA